MSVWRFFYFAYYQHVTIILKIILRIIAFLDVSFRELLPLQRSPEVTGCGVFLLVHFNGDEHRGARLIFLLTKKE